MIVGLADRLAGQRIRCSWHWCGGQGTCDIGSGGGSGRFGCGGRGRSGHFN